MADNYTVQLLTGDTNCHTTWPKVITNQLPCRSALQTLNQSTFLENIPTFFVGRGEFAPEQLVGLTEVWGTTQSSGVPRKNESENWADNQRTQMCANRVNTNWHGLTPLHIILHVGWVFKRKYVWTCALCCSKRKKPRQSETDAPTYTLGKGLATKNWPKEQRSSESNMRRYHDSITIPHGKGCVNKAICAKPRKA